MGENKTSRFVLSYFWGNIITSVASLISFPILTRVFSVSEYGILSLVFSTLTIAYVFSKMGIQNSIVRFYPEYEIGGEEKKSVFFSTYFFPIISTGIAFGILYIFIIPFVTKNILSLQDNIPFYAAALFIPTHSIFSVAGNFFRARQEPVRFNVLSILETYFPLLFGLSSILVFGSKIEYFFLGGFFGKAVYIFYFGNKIIGSYNLSPYLVSKDLLEKAFLYGFPLMLLELSGNLLAYGDRFIIKYFMSTKDVAIYSVGYNLAMYMANVFVIPLNSAVQVEYMKIWVIDGKLKTEEYLSKTCKAIMYFGIIYCVLALLNFKYVIIVLASKKYMESVAIAPFVITSVMIYTLYPIFGAGIFISKTTSSLFYCVLGALVLNFSVNVLLIPWMGILGAAIATFVANVIAALFIYMISNKVVAIKIRPVHIFGCLLAGGIAYGVCDYIEFDNIFLGLVTKSLAALGIYSLIIMRFDAEYKYYCNSIYNSVIAKIGRSK